MKNKILEFIGTGFYTGYVPFAPGTATSLLALSFFFIPGFNEHIILIPLILCCFIIGFPLGNYFESKYGSDPQIFTLDEMVGTWISLLLVPDNLIFIFSTFILWRFLDIVKPFPAKNLEKLNGGFGIMMDDVVSGMYSLIIIYIFNVLFYQ